METMCQRKNVKITVFTPTYNRAYLLEQLYRSLQQQTYTDFEWLVVDDGSTDNTEALFEQWQREGNTFPIRFHKQANGGKCRAINHALDLAEGTLFLVVDSDDYLTEDALLKIAKWESLLPKDEPFCGVSGNLGTAPGQTPNTRIEAPFYDGTLLDRYRNIDGERAFAFYTAVHRQYRYPEFPNEKFMTEAVVYNRMAHDGYKMRFYNDIVCIYEYQEDGLTKSGNTLFLNNPRGYGLWLREKAEFLHASGMEKLRMYYTFTCDLSDRYPWRFIRECIGAPSVLVNAVYHFHKLRRRKNEQAKCPFMLR